MVSEPGDGPARASADAPDRADIGPQVRAAQLQAILQSVRAGLWAALPGVGVAALGWHLIGFRSALWPWAAVTVAATLFGLFVVQPALQRLGQRGEATRALRLQALFDAGFGALWGSSALIFWGTDTPQLMVLAVVVGANLMSSAMATAASLPSMVSMVANAMHGDRGARLAARIDDDVTQPIRVDSLVQALQHVERRA